MGPLTSFTSGELDENAWDRVELQPLAKGCALAQNLVIRVAGPLGKRRGFWLAGPIADQAHLARLIPFIRAPNDAVVLEFGDLTCHVWQTNGTPLIDGGTGLQVVFATPFTDAQIAGLRYKQIGNVIELRHASGTIAPQKLVRTSNTSWAFNGTTYKNGPWLAENTDRTSTVSLNRTAGPAEIHDGEPTNSGCIPATCTVDITASSAIFAANMVGAQLRVRANGSSVSAFAWAPAKKFFNGDFVTSVGNAYVSTAGGAGGVPTGTNPPVQDQGDQSDGVITWTFLHDGAGVITIDAFTDAMHVSGTVVRPVPLKSGVDTSYWAFGAYSDAEGWPTAWPELREERLVEGATSNNLDFADLTQTAGFSPTEEDFTPGTGLGVIVATNALRRRVGGDGGQILWFREANYLMAGTTSGEYLVAGSVLDEPLSATDSGVTIKQLGDHGSADVFPAKAHKGLLFVTASGQSLRWHLVDNSQGAESEDFSYLSQHIATRGFAQLAWVKEPDNNLWIRLADGGLACMTYHREQQVRGFTSQALGGGLTALDAIVMPGPGNRATLWMIASQPAPGGGTQSVILMQSQPSDGLFVDCGVNYAGAPAHSFATPAILDGQPLDVVADGVWYPGLAPAAGALALPAGVTASAVQAGFSYPVAFKSLKIVTPQGFSDTSLMDKARIAGALVDAYGALYTVASDDGDFSELVSNRTVATIPQIAPARTIRQVTLIENRDSETSSRDPRVLVSEATPFDFVLYGLKPIPGGTAIGA